MSTLTLVREKVLKLAEPIPDVRIDYVSCSGGYVSFKAYRFLKGKTLTEDFAMQLGRLKGLRLAVLDVEISDTVQAVVKRLNEHE